MATTLNDLFVALRAFVADHYSGDMPREIKILSQNGQKIHLTLPVASGSPFAAKPVAESEDDWQPFTPTPFQKGILKALEGKALRTDALGAAVGDRSRLFRKGGLNELKERGLVEHNQSAGYYRPDAPPPNMAIES